MTQEQFAQLQKSFSTYLGPDTYSKIAMLSPSEGEQILKDTNTKMQNDATTSAEKWLNKLTSPYQEYAGMNIAAGQQFQQAVAPQEEEARKSSEYYQSLVQKGPMFELAMRPELAKISPTFMGANRRDLDAKLTADGITDPFQKQQMIDSYLSYADKAMTMSLSSLGQLYDSAVIAARTAAEDKQSIYQKVADIYKEAYSVTLMANKDWLDSKLKSSETTKGEKIVPWSLVAAKAGLVGLTQEQAQDLLSSETAPKWFLDQVSKQLQMSPTSTYLQQLWDETRKPVIEATKTSSGSAIDDIWNTI